ncbi:hypothetical protein K435DRAFT_873227 [Dendrothele bispora CBS 962.96]|uniref:Uncharacterized protein n=1 Tax=Dendrothele bispora (strain CBS 962.96) TaxID=1314807 RepID=A0A4S8KZP5_DENBC|nr:hypothetical protein K435DRAFT_873227 [Dendrothele bispora CBS 962.96]
MLMRDVPIGVLWSDLSTKLSIAPFRWAPKSIAGCPVTTYMDTQTGICDEFGLHIQAEAFALEKDEVKLDAMLPLVFNIISSDSGSLFGQVRLVASREKLIPLQQHLAFFFRPEPVKTPYAILVAVENLVESTVEDHQKEFVCKIVGHLFAYRPRPEHTTDSVFRVSTSRADQRWCIT